MVSSKKPDRRVCSTGETPQRNQRARKPISTRNRITQPQIFSMAPTACSIPKETCGFWGGGASSHGGAKTNAAVHMLNSWIAQIAQAGLAPPKEAGNIPKMNAGPTLLQ